MKRRHFLTISSAALLAACNDNNKSETGAGGTETEPTAEVTEEVTPKILVIGDSIAAGYNASIAFPDLIQRQTGIKVVSNAVPGRSAEHGYSVAKLLLDRHTPTFCAVLLGTNNANGAAGLEAGAVNAINAIIALCHARDIIPVVGTLPPITNSAAHNARAANISGSIRSMDARIAEVRNTVPASMIVDGLHPNNTGQRIIADTFSPLFV